MAWCSDTEIHSHATAVHWISRTRSSHASSEVIADVVLHGKVKVFEAHAAVAVSVQFTNTRHTVCMYRTNYRPKRPFILCLCYYASKTGVDKLTLGIFIGGRGARAPWIWETKVPSGVQGGKVPQKLQQFADILYRFWHQKWSKFENFTQFNSWFLSRPLSHGWCHHSKVNVWRAIQDSWMCFEIWTSNLHDFQH